VTIADFLHESIPEEKKDQDARIVNVSHHLLVRHVLGTNNALDIRTVFGSAARYLFDLDIVADVDFIATSNVRMHIV